MSNLKRLTIVCAGTWCALRDDLPDQLREALSHGRTALTMGGKQLHAHVVSSEREDK